MWYATWQSKWNSNPWSCSLTFLRQRHCFRDSGTWPQADILLLLGRDVIQAHYVLEHGNGPPNHPFTQRLALGWVIVGNICLGGARKSGHVNVLKTNILDNGWPSYLFPCQNSIQVKESFNQGHHKTLRSKTRLKSYPQWRGYHYLMAVVAHIRHVLYEGWRPEDILPTLQQGQNKIYHTFSWLCTYIFTIWNKNLLTCQWLYIQCNS